MFGGITLAFRVRNAVYLILVGGILTAFGIDIGFAFFMPEYGYYLVTVGSMLSVISGVVGLKMLPSLITEEKEARRVGQKR